LDFNATSGLSREASASIDFQTEALELEELVDMVETGKDEDGRSLSESELRNMEQRILVLDSKLRGSKGKQSNFKKHR
jgi:hypothetical protein